MQQLPPDAINPSDIPAELDRQASISTSGGAGGGSITIRHGGGNQNIPFIVGNVTTNGTAGSITTRPSNTILPNRTFFGSYTQDNIRIITSQQQPPPNPDIPSVVDPIPLQEPPTQVPIATLDEARKVLRRIEQRTGVKPALIYVRFSPSLLVSDPSFTRREELLTMIGGKVRLQEGKLMTASGSFPLTPELAKLGDRELSHPYYWSAFTMIGNPW